MSITREFGTFNYAHDPMDQLLAVTYSGTQTLGAAANRSVQYDFNGNRVMDSIRGNASYVNNMLAGDVVSSYIPTADGTASLASIVDRATGTQKNFNYRADGRLAQYSDSSLAAAYAFDALGRRISKSVTKGEQSITQSLTYIGDTDQALMGEAGDGSVTVYLQGQGLDEHLAQISGKGVKAYAIDHEGSILNSETTGTVHAFGSFGEILGTNPELTTSSDPAVFGWQGLGFDPEMGMWDNKRREYDPNTGRFPTVDPIGFSTGETNLYRSRKNSPLDTFDYSGLAACTFNVSSGTLVCQSNYSGALSTKTNVSGRYGLRNDPAFSSIKDLGPIPRGQYFIGAKFMKHGYPRRRLYPRMGTHNFNRTGFQIHGCGNPATCSEGCLGVRGNQILNELNDFLDIDSTLGEENYLDVEE